MSFYNIFKQNYIPVFGVSFMVNSYFSAKREIIRFREGKVDSFDLTYHKINTELDAGWCGVTRDSPNNLFFSWFWPVTLPLSTIPYIASKITPEKDIEKN